MQREALEGDIRALTGGGHPGASAMLPGSPSPVAAVPTSATPSMSASGGPAIPLMVPPATQAPPASKAERRDTKRGPTLLGNMAHSRLQEINAGSSTAASGDSTTRTEGPHAQLLNKIKAEASKVQGPFDPKANVC